MRRQFVKTVESIFEKDDKVITLLGDIGVYGFRNLFEKYPERIYNIGILEQSMVSLAAGLASEGLIPIIHTIAPFIVERALEQIKIDFGYQGLGGNIVSVGGSYDYPALGCTHQCPGDVGILKNIPNTQIVIPGHPKEFDSLFRQSYSNRHLSYFRLSERSNTLAYRAEFGKAQVIKAGMRATVIAVGPVLDAVVEACEGLDVGILYYTTVNPFDRSILKGCSTNVLICEPYYSGALDYNITESSNQLVNIKHVGVPHEFLSDYGTVEDHDTYVGLTVQSIRTSLGRLINE